MNETGDVTKILQPTIMLNLIGIAISLMTSYIPGFREWYATRTSAEKGLGQVIAITLVVVVCGILSWTKIVAIVTPDYMGFVTLAGAWFSALTTNQATYMLSPKVESVKMVEASKTSTQLDS